MDEASSPGSNSLAESPLSRRVELWTAAGCLILLLGQLVYGLRTDGMTDDEVVYVAPGYRYLALGDFRMNAEHPPLAKLLAGLPQLAFRPTVPELRPNEDQCGWSYRFLHEANRGLPLLAWARVPAVVLTVGLAILVWRWGRATSGPAAGLLALAFFAFHPSLLAHGHLAATDLPSAAAMVASSWCFWRWGQRPGIGWSLAGALAFGAVVVTRFSGWILLPALALLVLVEVRRSPAVRQGLPLWVGAHLVIVPLVIWAAYGFRYEPWPGEPNLFFGWNELASPAGRFLKRVSEWGVLPRGYLDGLRFQAVHGSEGHSAYFLGERGTQGWWSYYVVVFLIKNTPGFLLFLGAAAVQSFRRGRPAVEGVAGHWLVPAGAVFLLASAGRIQIGERYILVVYPYLILWAACTLAPWLRSRRSWSLVALGLALHALPVLAIARHGYLAYFNSMGGGREGGHRWVADSNLDWGQDLPRLAAWMRERGVPRVQLGYFGTDDPDRYGIAHDDLPAWHSHHPVHAPRDAFRGTVVVSPNLLLGFLMPPGKNPYETLRGRTPVARVGALFVYDLGAPR